MKKILFTIVLVFTALLTTGCSMMFAQPQYDYEEAYSEDYAYLDDYALVDWDSPQYDLQYSYYDSDRVFLVIYGNRIYIIPYEYFYHYIIPRFRGRIIWRSYDWLCNWWGYGYYNSLWSHWYHRHHRPHWRPRFDYYYHHRNSGHNRPFIIRKDSLRQPDGYRRTIPVQPRRETMRAIPRNERRYVPKSEFPRNERRYVPKSEFPRSFNTPHRETGVIRHQINPQHRLTPPPPPVKKDDGGSARAKR